MAKKAPKKSRSLDKYLPKIESTWVQYRGWREEIAAKVAEGRNFKEIHGALEKAGATMAYSTLCKYLGKEKWEGLEDDGIDMASLKAATVQTTRNWRTSKRKEAKKKNETKPSEGAEEDDNHEPLQPAKNAGKPTTFTLTPTHEINESDLI